MASDARYEAAMAACIAAFHAWCAGRRAPDPDALRAIPGWEAGGAEFNAPRFATWLDTLREPWVAGMRADPVALRATLGYERFCEELVRWRVAPDA